MFGWLFDRQWNKRRSDDRNLEGVKFTVRQGRRYKATITLVGIESWGGNSTIAGKLIEAGFKDVKVTGGGYRRTGEGTWSKSDTTAEIDSHLSNITEMA